MYRNKRSEYGAMYLSRIKFEPYCDLERGRIKSFSRETIEINFFICLLLAVTSNNERSGKGSS